MKLLIIIVLLTGSMAFAQDDCSMGMEAIKGVIIGNDPAIRKFTPGKVHNRQYRETAVFKDGLTVTYVSGGCEHQGISWEFLKFGNQVFTDKNKLIDFVISKLEMIPVKEKSQVIQFVDALKKRKKAPGEIVDNRLELTCEYATCSMEASKERILLVSTSVSSEVVILHQKKEDLNKDGKKDSIAWIANSKDAKRPSRLVIRVLGKVRLDLPGDFCAPDEKAPECTPLNVYKRLSPKEEPLLVFENDSSTYIYRWQRGAFRPYSASWVSKNERHEINYSTSRALVSVAKKTLTCPLKKARSQEELYEFSMFDIRNEANCPKSK